MDVWIKKKLNAISYDLVRKKYKESKAHNTNGRTNHLSPLQQMAV